MKDKKHFWLICFLLAVVTFAVFVPTVNYDFINYDDPQYVTENETVQRGLAWGGIVWAFQTGHTGNWHPITWISHMLDCQLYGLSPAGHHLTNLLFHVFNTLLLFYILMAGTRAMWRSAVVAALFSLHPMHIESVAWISERKDVLSTFFLMLTLIAYFRYVQNRTKITNANEDSEARKFSSNYFLAMLFFSLGLMSKPMLVTLPFVLLLLDFWPLQRICFSTFKWNYFFRLWVEKIPFFALAIASSIITFFVQKNAGSVSSLTSLSIFDRVANSLVAYVKYFALLLWPTKLTVLYPLRHWTATQAVVAGLFLAFVSILTIRVFSRRPYMALGWFWFLGILIPVIGLVQVGSQSMADRYSYVPSIGVFILLVWTIADCFSDQRLPGILAAAALVTCAILTSRQLPYWQNSITLFERALVVTEKNYIAHNNLGSAYRAAERAQDAIVEYEEAIRLKPNYAQAFYNLGNVLSDAGKTDKATDMFLQALHFKPDFGIAHLSLGIALARQGNFGDAIAHYRFALQSYPKDWKAHYNLANALIKNGEINEAILHYLAALDANPEDAHTHNNLASAFQQQGKIQEAMAHFSEALRLQTNYPEAHFNLALILIRQGKNFEAVGHLENVVRGQPQNEQAHFQLGTLYASQSQLELAIQHFRAALQLKPDWAAALNFLSRVLATSREVKFRNGNEAARLAEEACRLTHHENIAYLDTLGAALAEKGDFVAAARTAQIAKELAAKSDQKIMAEQIELHIRQYQNSQPLREF